MATIRPGSSTTLVRDAHTHAIAATASYAAFVAGLQAVASESAAARQRRQDQRHRETDYARGILGERPAKSNGE